MHVQEHVHLAEIQKEKRCLSRLNVVDGLAEDLCIAQLMIRIDPMSNALARQLVENGRRAADPARVVDILLLDVVEPRQESRTYATFKQRPHAEDAPSELFDDLAGHAVIEYHIW